MLFAADADKRRDWGKSRRWMYFVLAAVAIVVLGALSTTIYDGLHIAQVHMQQLATASKIRSETGLAHLWLEEVLAGDTQEHFEVVLEHLDLARNCVQALLGHGEIQGIEIGGRFEAELKSDLEVLENELQAISDLAEQRYALGQEAGVGSEMDKSFDEAFIALLATVGKIEEKLSSQNQAKIVTFRIGSSIVAVGCVLLVLFAAFWLRSYEKQRGLDLNTILASEEDLRQLNEELTATNEELEAQFEELTAANQEVLDSQEALRTTTDELQMIFDSVPAAIWYKDTENKFLRVNHAAAESVGMAPEEIEGKTAYELFPNDAEHYYEDDQIVIRSGKPKQGIIERLIKPNGEELTVITDKVPHRNSLGEIVGIVVFVVDVTERLAANEALAQLNKEMNRTNQELNATNEELKAQHTELVATNQNLLDSQEAQEESERLARSLLDAFPCVALLGRPGSRKIVASNKAAMEIGAIPGATCYGTWGQMETPCQWCRAQEVWDGKGPQNLIVEHLGRWWNAYWIPVSKDLYMHFVLDITDTKKQEIALQKSEAEFQDLYENAPDMYASVDAETARITRCNQTLLNKLGYTRDEIIGREIFEMYHENCMAEVHQGFEQFILTGEVRDAERQLKRKDGSPLAVSLNVSAVRDAQGTILHGRSVWRDITQRKRLEQQLRQTQKMEAIGTLAGGIAHDFNNILFAILGNAELAADEIPEDHPARDNIREVITAGERAAELVKQILTFARRGEKRTAAISVASIVKEVVKMLRAWLPTTIEINLRLSTANTTIVADPTEIHQVIMNLCTNAGQAMLEHGGQLELGLSELVVDEFVIQQNPDLHEGLHLVLSVSDTGPGIPSSIQGRIFEPFFTTKEAGEGTGMGLAVVHGIVHELGGTIKVDSKIGEGTRFNVYLPLASAGVGHEKSHANEIPRGTEHVLVVDDEPAIAKIIADTLKGLGYTVTVFSDSQEALATFLGAPDDFDLIITDQTMHKLTGAQLAQKILAEYPQQPIILLTGFSQTMPRETAEEIGIAAYLSKPVARNDLALRVRGVLDRVEPDAGQPST